ncbi:glycosyltransferase [Brevibacillus humidisoli]|uniref:glycosyltransferase n=1 Tax=Brevibacillus humidisoli TaxID=2895522 RepID=UPI001E437476|nr:glycosyltransferase [Brevibacillus humidisoli]UFJ42530.1 glycosyltransferase [Brevibacillus humidisoli]
MESRENQKEYLRMFLQEKVTIFLKNQASVMTFPTSEQPDISIILVVYNKAEYTYQCLETIKAHADVPYEIIIVDNGSSDQTSALLSKVENVTLVKNNENAGFLKGCNQGANVARGKWLLFLNNDTQIMPGLLSSLLHTGETTPQCAAVGGKLIFPDGKLQEAGSIIWSDGSCLGYGRDDDPFKPEYSYLKEVDFCSGACLLVKTEIFRQAGMFDKTFAPAYYEEADLCMNIRELGYKVIFQPAAVAIHYEFGSSSSMEEAIALQVQNRTAFVGKWKKQLCKFYPPAFENILYAREHGSRQKYRVLVVDDRIPVAELGSGFPRSLSILDGLAEAGFQVTLFPLQIPQKVEPYTYRLHQKGIEAFFNTIEEKLRFEEFLESRKHYYHAVWISRPHNMTEVVDVIKKVNPNQRIIYDAEALYSDREILQLELNGDRLSEKEKREMVKKEMELIYQADAVVTVSERERQTIIRNGFKEVEVLAHSVNLRVTPNGFGERQDILFVGGFLASPSPNEDAIYYFVREIFEQVHAETGAKLWIVGTNYLDSIKSLASERIIVTDQVDDVGEYYNKCRVFVVPTRYAAGIPIKLLECMAHGVPAVVTPLISEQLGLKDEVVLVGNTPRVFSEKVVSCYSDKNMWNRLRQNGINYVKNNFHADQFKATLKKLIKP